jgi:hypothetical protein
METPRRGPSSRTEARDLRRSIDDPSDRIGDEEEESEFDRSFDVLRVALLQFFLLDSESASADISGSAVGRSNEFERSTSAVRTDEKKIDVQDRNSFFGRISSP